MTAPLVELRDLQVHFPITRGAVWRRHVGVAKAVDGVSLAIARGETLGLVGESGSGKSTLGRAVLRLLPATDGNIHFDGRNITTLRGEALRHARRHFQMIFQDPYASLDPRMMVGHIIAEAITTHGVVRGTAVRAEVQRLMHLVGLNPRYIRRYPHEFSGGQRQRIGIARALAVRPQFIVADEPTSALDVSIQAQILNLLTELRTQLHLTMLFISHDLAAVRHVSDRVAVMYLGRLVEVASYDDIYNRPQHPYTQALLSALPVPDPARERHRERIVLRGDIPSPLHPPAGCPFHTRCPYAMPRCTTDVPPLKTYAPHHATACHLLEG